MTDFNKDSPYWYGLRHGSNQPKAAGFFGELPIPGANSKATEYSIDVDMGGRNVQIPTLVPSLTSSQLSGLMQDIGSEKPPTNDVVQKAVDHARYRMALGQSPFWRMPEKHAPVPVSGLLGDW